MAKSLPYFKFYCSEWNDGDITLEDMKTQGVFINICSYYWSQECEVLEEKLLKRFKNYLKQIENLKKEKIIFSENGNLVIKFLDKQWQERELLKLRNQQNGKAGGRPKKTQSVNSGKPNENPNITNKEEKREEEKREDIKSKPKRFTPPQLHEVSQYCLERNNRVDAQHFLDHYTARGWILNNGKQVKDWKACVRTWEKNNFNRQPQDNNKVINHGIDLSVSFLDDEE